MSLKNFIINGFLTIHTSTFKERQASLLKSRWTRHFFSLTHIPLCEWYIATLLTLQSTIPWISQCNKTEKCGTYLVYGFDRRKRSDANFPHGYRKLLMQFLTVTIYVFHIRRHYWEINTFLSVNAVFDLWDMRIDWIQLTGRLFMYVYVKTVQNKYFCTTVEQTSFWYLEGSSFVLPV